MKALSQLRSYQSPKPRITAALPATSRRKLWKLRRTRERRGHQRWPSKMRPKNHRVPSQLLQSPRRKLLLKLLRQCRILPKRNHPRRSLPSSRTLLLWAIRTLRGQFRKRPDHLLSVSALRHQRNGSILHHPHLQGLTPPRKVNRRAAVAKGPIVADIIPHLALLHPRPHPHPSQALHHLHQVHQKRSSLPPRKARKHLLPSEADTELDYEEAPTEDGPPPEKRLELDMTRLRQELEAVIESRMGKVRDQLKGSSEAIFPQNNRWTRTTT